MDIDIVLKNYRCFSIENPARFQIKNGFTSFVGVNNSGKSALLKFFYEFRGLFLQLSNIEHLFRSLSRGTSLNFPITVKDKTEVFNNSNANNMTIEFCFSLPTMINEKEKIKFVLETTFLHDTNVYQSKLYHLSNGKKELEKIKISENILYLEGNKFDFTPLSSTFSEIGHGIYIGPFRNAIFVGGQQKYYDIEIGQDFIQTWSQKKTGDIKKETQTVLELEQDIKRIFGFKDFSINANHSKDSLNLIIDGKVFGLDEVGSGIAQLIVVLTNVMLKTPPYVFIDEPESNLHPSLQLSFLSALGNYTSKSVIIATHNIGLARSISNNIYTLIKDKKGNSVVRVLEKTPRLSELLGELSFSGYREMGFDELLLVEGRTEIKTFFQFLRLYNIDQKVLMVPLGGSDLINGNSEEELLELKRITPNISAIIDSEKINPNAELASDRKDFVEICKRIGINCHVLERTATDNYLTERAIQSVKSDKYRALGKYGKLKDLEFPWAKNENWKIARQMNIKEIQNNDLGRFISGISRRVKKS